MRCRCGFMSAHNCNPLTCIEGDCTKEEMPEEEYAGLPLPGSIAAAQQKVRDAEAAICKYVADNYVDCGEPSQTRSMLLPCDLARHYEAARKELEDLQK